MRLVLVWVLKLLNEKHVYVRTITAAQNASTYVFFACAFLLPLFLKYLPGGWEEGREGGGGG